MSGAVRGHGYRETLVVTPRCKCGWSGGPCDTEIEARRLFEIHKARLRHQMGKKHPSMFGSPRRLEVVR